MVLKTTDKPTIWNVMIKETYPYLPSDDKLVFVFQSEGKQGSILKIIIFSHSEGNEWNLGFGDLQSDDINDSIISNNHDAMKIIRTVAKTTLDFFGEYPNSIVDIKPIDEKRKRFYNLIFQKYFAKIDTFFNIVGISNNFEEGYSPQKFYDRFKISSKFV